jgi:hypothetical protein
MEVWMFLHRPGYQQWLCSPWLGETIVNICWVSRRKEHHVVAEAKRHELKTPEPDHHAEPQMVLGIGHLEPWWECGVYTQ